MYNVSYGPLMYIASILKFQSKMADLQEIAGFLILSIWRPFCSQISVLNDLTYIMPMHEHCLLWPIDVHSFILKFQSKMADLREITGFPILSIWKPCMNNVSYGQLMYIASY